MSFHIPIATSSILIDRYLPSNLTRGFSKSVILKENFVIDFACCHSALCVHFDHQLLGRGPHPDLKQPMHQYFTQGAGKFDKLVVADGAMRFLSLDNARLVREVGAQCAIRMVIPFSVNKPKDSAFVLSVASSFERVYRRLFTLWTPSSNPSRLIVTGAIMREIIDANDRSEYAQAGLYSKLALEWWCLEAFHLGYSTLSDAQKANLDKDVTRTMFWAASFFYAMLERKNEAERLRGNVIIPHWDQEGGDLNGWIDARLAVYLEETSAGPRSELYGAVHGARDRLLKKGEALLRLDRVIVGLDRHLTRQVADIAKQIRSCEVERYGFTPDELWQINYNMGDGLRASLFIVEEHLNLHAVSVDEDAPAVPAAEGAITQSIIAEIDRVGGNGLARAEVDELVLHSDAMDVGDAESKRSKNQRRRDAKERQFAEAAVLTKALYDSTMAAISVLNERAAADAAKDHADWLEDKGPLMIKAANVRIRKAVEAHRKNERRALEAAEQQRRREEELANEQRRREEELALQQRRREEELALQQRRREEELANERAAAAAADRARLAHLVARTVVLELSEEGALPTDFSHTLVQRECPTLGFILDPDVECFICIQPIDFADQGVRFLQCCAGGSFACSACIGHHVQHPVVGELKIVQMAAAIRRKFGIRHPALQ
jgi:hypothetical protein